MVLPILTFDEHALSPRFGYVFDAAWLEPHESILGMLWKFMRANRPAAAAVVLLIWAVSAARSHDPISWERATEKNRNT